MVSHLIQVFQLKVLSLRLILCPVLPHYLIPEARNIRKQAI